MPDLDQLYLDESPPSLAPQAWKARLTARGVELDSDGQEYELADDVAAVLDENGEARVLYPPGFHSVRWYGAGHGNADHDTAAFLTAVALAKVKDGFVLVPVGTYKLNATVVIPGGVTVAALPHARVICTPAIGFAGPMFELTKGTGEGHLEFSGQGWRPALKNITLRPGAMPTSAELVAGIPDTRQVADGVWVHETDGFVLDNVVVEMLAGYHFKIGPVAREASIDGCRSWRGGAADTDKAAVIFENGAGDPNNLIDLSGIHIGYPAYIGLDFSETGELALQGSRMVQFFGGQIEGGGYGGDEDHALQTSSNMPAHDLIRVKSGRDITWHGTEIGGGTQAGKSLVKLDGNTTSYLGTMEFRGCPINNVGAGASLDCNRIGVLKVAGGTLFANTAAGATHLKTTSNTVRVEWDPAVQVSSAGEDDQGMGDADLSKVKRNRLNWVPLTPLNGWSNTGGVYQTSRACVDRAGIVRVQGTLTPGTTTLGTSVANLPAGMRPAKALKFSCEDNGGPAGVTVADTGDIYFLIGTPLAGNPHALSLDGITFAAA